MSVQRRLNMGFVALFLLFVTFLGVQFGVGSRLSAGHHDRVARIHAARIANEQVLQRMTDAETGLRGFQLTGDPAFLDPYESGRNAAVAALDEVSGNTADEAVRTLVDRERVAVLSWLREYAAPAVAGGRPAQEVCAVRGKQMFDELRLVNDAVSVAIEAEAAAEERADTAGTRLLATGLGALGLAILTLGYAVVRTCYRQLLTPLESLGRTIRRQAAGERTARAEPVGAAELRPVVEALNDLAAQTEALLAAEQARAA